MPLLLVISKWLMSLVFPGVPEVFAMFFLFTNMLMRLLLPTLLRPMKANSGLSGAGHCSMSVDDLRNVALVGSIVLSAMCDVRSAKCEVRSAFCSSLSQTERIIAFASAERPFSVAVQLIFSGTLLSSRVISNRICSSFMAQM